MPLLTTGFQVLKHPCFLFYRSSAWKHPPFPLQPYPHCMCAHMWMRVHAHIREHAHQHIFPLPYHTYRFCHALRPWEDFPVSQTLVQLPSCLLAPVALCTNPYWNTDHTVLCVHEGGQSLSPSFSKLSILMEETILFHHVRFAFYSFLVHQLFARDLTANGWPVNICGIIKLINSTEYFRIT